MSIQADSEKAASFLKRWSTMAAKAMNATGGASSGAPRKRSSRAAPSAPPTSSGTAGRKANTPVPPLDGGGGDDGDSSPDEPMAKTFGRIAAGLAAVMIGFGVGWWYTHDTPPNRTKTELAYIRAGEAADTERERTKQERERTKQVIAGAQLGPITAPVAVARPSPGQPSLTTSFSAGKQRMIAECGRKFQEATYKPDPGCFYFDNNQGTVEKTIQLWSRTRVRHILPEFEEKKGLALSAPGGETCISDATQTCISWVRNQPRSSDGFIKFTVKIPANQALMAHLDLN